MVDAACRNRIWERAASRCEYCGLAQEHVPYNRFHVEHIIPKVHGGDDDDANLALACDRCNFHKGTNLAGIDPETKEIIPLFHPREQDWNEHFEMGAAIKGLTPSGKATIEVLKMNVPRRLLLRSKLIANSEL